jgi:hypothetical protein
VRPAGFEPATDGVGDLPGAPDHRDSLIIIMSRANLAEINDRISQDHDRTSAITPMMGNKVGNGSGPASGGTAGGFARALPPYGVAWRRGRRAGRGLRISGSSLPSRVVMVSLVRLDELEKRNLFWTGFGVAIGVVVVLGILFAVLF